MLRIRQGLIVFVMGSILLTLGCEKGTGPIAGLERDPMLVRVPGDAPTIQAAFRNAQPGDVIELDPGTYRESLLPMPPGIRLRAADPSADATVIDGGGEGPLLRLSPSGRERVISGITFRNGIQPSGGPGQAQASSIACDGATVTLEDCRFVPGDSAAGVQTRVIHALASAVTIRSCEFTSLPIAIMTEGGTAVIEGSRFVACQQAFMAGGGTANFRETAFEGQVDVAINAWGGCNITLESCTFQANPQGSIYGYSAGTLSLFRGRFLENGARDWPYADVYWYGARTLATLCTFEGSLNGGLIAETDVSRLQETVFRRCQGSPAVYLLGSRAEVSTCRFDSCAGSAMTIGTASAMLQSCGFEGNLGGGLVSGSSNLELRQCEFIRNAAGEGAGVVHTSQEAKVRLLGCLFDGNVATRRGGGAMLANADVLDCTFLRNSAGESGGALVLIAGGQVSRSLFCWNQARQGGAIELDSWTGVDRCTLYENDAELGSAIFAYPGFGGSNLIVTWNRRGAPLACQQERFVLITCSDVYGNEAGDYVGPLDGQEGINGNIEADPLFYDAAAGVFYLRLTSPCLGSPCYQMGAFGHGLY